MSRRSANFKREIIPDPVFKDPTVTKFVNIVMYDGKKSVAQNMFYDALEELKTKVPAEDPIMTFKKALENVKPALEVRSRRVGGATYQVPMDVRPVRRTSLAMRWLVQYARERTEKTMALRLAAEIADAYNNRGNSIKKKDDVHRMAEANKAFAHYRW